MKATAYPNDRTDIPRGGIFETMARKAVQLRLGQLERGTLIVHDTGQEQRFEGSRPGPRVSLTVHDPAFYSSVLTRGTVGAGESYVRGEWTTEDLVALVRLMVLNRATLDQVDSGLARLAQPVLRFVHALHRNSVRGSRRNIAAHYDLSNDFFALLLDPTMTYSCGVFETPDATLEEASVAKLDRICRKLRVQPSHHVLEIGTGWGSFAIHAAEHYGCRVTTTTVSRQQYELARHRIAERGLEDRITVLLKDYRLLDGQYDRLVSIEMIEAVGHHYYETFFRRCGELLTPDGAMLLQSITIQDRYYEQARRSVDFIKRYIFPGCCIPAVGVLHEAMTAASDLQLAHLEQIGPHYATTLAAWRRQLLARRSEIKALGYEDQFIRTWEFYLAYCEGGFAERQLGDVQMLLVRGDHRGELPLPAAARLEG